MLTFTVLWAISCTILYFLLLREYNRASRLHEKSIELYNQAIKDNEETAEILKQLKESMMSPN
jgi:hypothetical protein